MTGRVYLAGRYSRREELLGYARQLEERGCTITSRWLQGTHEGGDGNAASLDDMERWAAEDIQDIYSADVLILFTESPDGGYSRGGRHFEAGLAYALGRRLLIVGPVENVFYVHLAMNGLRFDSFDACLRHWWLR